MHHFTPGPWTIDAARYDRKGERHRDILHDGARVFTMTDRADQPTISEANARLIAAAPDLLRACRDALKVFEIASRYFPKSIKNSDRFKLLNIEANSVMKAIRAAEGDDETAPPTPARCLTLEETAPA
jgi:hypothetical protein